MAIFVPRWGWVVSLHTNDFIKLDMFSSPLGDGVVHEKRKVNHKNNHDFRPRLGMGWFEYDPTRQWDYRIFSSPLGVGLVQKRKGVFNNEKHFRPRVGMGWFVIHQVLR